MPTPSHRSARRRGVILGAAISSRRSKPTAPQSAPAAPVASPPQQSSAMTTQLTELKSLLDSGVITQADFDAKKNQILGI